MRSARRMKIIGLSFVLTFLYTMLIVIDETVALYSMLGYCGLTLTLFGLDYHWSKIDES